MFELLHSVKMVLAVAAKGWNDQRRGSNFGHATLQLGQHKNSWCVHSWCMNGFVGRRVLSAQTSSHLRT